MHLASSLDCITSLPVPEDWTGIQRDLDPAWIEAALLATGTATMRRRRLPAEQVVWLVIGMALFRDLSITEVATSLDLALPTPAGGPTASRSAVCKARSRLGDKPLAWLFERTADHWAHASADRHRWRGLALYGLDGTTLRVPDSDDNSSYFGYASGGDRGDSGYPLLRLVALMALRSHLIAGVAFGPHAPGEQTLAADLWSAIPDHSLTINDKNFLAAGTLLSLQHAGADRHWLVPAKKNSKWRRLERFGRGDELVEMNVSKEARRKNPSLPQTWTARAIRYQRKGFRPRTLLTSLVDSTRYPAAETAAHHICLALLGYAFAAPGAIPKRLRKLREDVKRFILPPRRSGRSSPRAVKIKMSSYPKKRRPSTRKPSREGTK